MNRRLLILVSAPAVLIGLLLLGVCLAGARYVNHLQAQLSDILTSNVVSMEAAQQLETQVRQLRFHSFLYLMDPAPSLLADVQTDEQQFAEWLKRAEKVAFTSEEQQIVHAIRESYNDYERGLDKLRAEAELHGPRRELRNLAESHPVRKIVDLCHDYAAHNETSMRKTIQENSRLSQVLHLAMLLLGLGGPLSGILLGYGIARGLSRSLYRISVRVQDMAQHFEKDVAAVQLTPNGDLQRLDRQLQYVVRRVAEVTDNLRRQERDMLRAQQLASVGQLAASVAHEVRNPLTSIKILVEAGLRSHKPKPMTDGNLRVIHRDVLRLEQMVQSLLDYARPPEPQRQRCDMRGVIARALDLVRARREQQQVHMNVNLPDSECPAYADPKQLCTVLVNLLINALDAMPTGGTLTVDLTGDGSSLHVAVIDTGAGIEADMMPRLFQPFASSKSTGTGLGLVICKRVVEDHGGHIQADNRTEGGACFTLSLPQAVEVAHADAAGR